MFKQLNSAIPFKADGPTQPDTARLLPSRNVQQITPAPPPLAARTRLHADTRSLYQGPCLLPACVSTIEAIRRVCQHNQSGAGHQSKPTHVTCAAAFFFLFLGRIFVRVCTSVSAVLCAGRRMKDQRGLRQ